MERSGTVALKASSLHHCGHALASRPNLVHLGSAAAQLHNAGIVGWSVERGRMTKSDWGLTSLEVARTKVGTSTAAKAVTLHLLKNKKSLTPESLGLYAGRCVRLEL